MKTGESHVRWPVDVAIETEVLVIGSGVSGVCAAIQAGRAGCKTLLIEKDEVLGGNSGPNLGVHVSGAHSYHPYASETGVCGELEEEAAWVQAKMNTRGWHYNIARQWESVLHRKLEESGVTILKRHYAKMPIVERRRITGVIVEDTGTFRTKRINVSHFVIEASGDGQIAALAGSEFRMGREARSQTGERSAPEVPDKITMGTSMTMLVHKTDRPVKFVPPPGTPEWEPPDFDKAKLWGTQQCLTMHSAWHPDADLCFIWPTESGGQLDTIKDDDQIYEELLKQCYSVWDHIKNKAHAKESANWDLIWISPKAGKRESRRFIGDYVLTQDDVEAARDFPDKVAYGGYFIDVHEPVGTRSKVVCYSVPPLYNIPYRCLYSKDFDNLFLVGRLASVTHLALGTVRLMKTGGVAGEAVGVAAGLCKKHNCTPREIHVSHVQELQQELLRKDATLLNLKNADPDDLARTATVTATSESLFECIEATDFLPLNVARGVILYDWPQELAQISFPLRNATDKTIDVPFQVRLYKPKQRWKDGEDYRRYYWGRDLRLEKFNGVCEGHFPINPNYSGWNILKFEQKIRLAEKDPTSDDERCLILIGPAPGVEWGRQTAPVDFMRRCWVEKGALEAVPPEQHLLRISPRPSYGEAANVINGFNRRLSTCPANMWISKRGEALPQSLTLDFGAPKSFNTVHLTFDTLTYSYTEMPINSGQRVSPMCVKDYALEIPDGPAWRTLLSIAGNYNRFRVHTFPAITSPQLRLTVNAVHDPQKYTARVYEVRAYNK